MARRRARFRRQADDLAALDGVACAASGGQSRIDLIRSSRRASHAVPQTRQAVHLGPRATVVDTLSPAYVSLLLIHLHFPEAGSLKAKRKELASVKAQLHTRLGVAVSEVDGQDTWQRATLAGALTSGSLKQLQQATDHVEGWLLSRFPEGVRVERSLTSFEDAGGIG